ncbi:uncharacterized protein FPRO_04865 [Fusarium proliferatum ET1]|uniref:Uncharacterized protein n=1 Tax=Fusarium proliferatum (strain ET1) TaxID=1227346 RepID=A0A1L7VH70_FUSPR|nr:uncharacterized protein FPRO_04865 [Fusarium proliferatum ET1]CZR39967.1 uncharacterized protein FPRO_04865 [Fusarium proliferatum ET1]
MPENIASWMPGIITCTYVLTRSSASFPSSESRIKKRRRYERLAATSQPSHAQVDKAPIEITHLSTKHPSASHIPIIKTPIEIPHSSQQSTYRIHTFKSIMTNQYNTINVGGAGAAGGGRRHVRCNYCRR